MFDNIGGAELLIIALVGLFVLGPERLPAAAAWVADTVRSVRDFATGARDQLRQELGPEYEEFRKPIDDLRSVRELDPRRAVRQHLFSAGEPAAPGRAITGATDAVAHPGAPPATGAPTTGAPTTGRPAGGESAPIKGRTSSSDHRATPLTPGEAAPYDDDAT